MKIEVDEDEYKMDIQPPNQVALYRNIASYFIILNFYSIFCMKIKN